MKYLLIATVLILPLAACSDKSAPPTPATVASAPAPNGGTFVKADGTRPAALPAKLTAATSCSFDTLNGAPRGVSNDIANKAQVQLNGWIANTAATAAPGQVYLELDGPGKLYAAGTRGLKRPDVAAAFNNPVLLDSGWDAQLDLSTAPAGTYKLHLILVDGATATICDPNAALVIGS